MTDYWTTLSHNGVSFPDPYSPRGISVIVRGVRTSLSPLAEEMAYHLAKKKDTPYIKDEVFTANFMPDFSKQLPERFRSTHFDEIDFTEFYRVVDEEKAARDGMSKDEKKKLALSRKERREALKERYGRARLDGKEVDIANWMVEPPGLFMGRGAHPSRGRWKPRVNQSDVVLNLDETAPIPSGNWKEIVHDHNSMWMAKWIDKLTGKEKYVWLHESSPLQQSRNRAKYDNALKVGMYLPKIRSRMIKELASRDEPTRQVATICYLIDTLGMRVGDEKDEDESDTVGASTLRVEHIKFRDPDVEFDFLGKDSVPWNKKDTPPPLVLRNLRELTLGKKHDSLVFHDVDSGMVNDFLSSIVPGASAKVFRTFHATAKTEEALRSKDVRSADDLEKIYHAKEANLKAAIFCNHQRTPPKTWEHTLEKKKQKMEAAMAGSKHGDGRIKKLKMELDFFVRTKNYNLSTSLKNYIDPRVYKSWCDYVGLEWAKVYNKSMQKKFSWAEQSSRKWAQDEAAIKAVAASERPSHHTP